MADAVIDLQASNVFGLHANFKTESSGASLKTKNVATNDEKGNVFCQRNIDPQTDYTQSASYCGSDFVGDLGTFLTQFGNVQNSVLVTGVALSMSAGGYVKVTVTGHQHASNAHVAGLSVGYCDVSNFLPHETGESFAAWDGFGVPSFHVTTGTTASPSAASVTFSLNHIDTPDQAGAHFVGKNITPKAELKMDFEGIPTSDTAAELEADFGANTHDMLVPIVDSTDKNDSNSAFDTFSFTAHANTTLATA